MNYGDLKTHFNEVLNRSDISTVLTERFIDQGLARIQRSLRVPFMEKQRNYTISSSTSHITLPNDFLETRDLYHSSGTTLERVSMETMQALKANSLVGNPTKYAREQASLLLYPQPGDGTVTLNYYGELEAFVSDSTETTITKVAPDLVIYAGLTFAADFYLDERSPLFEAKFKAFLEELQEQSNDQELNGGTQSISLAFTYDEE
jgi:hypothetical protein